MSKEHKKRGRKPKSNIIVNNNPVFKNDMLNDIIVCINKTTTENKEDYLHCDNIDENVVTSNNIIHCKNCNYTLTNNKIELPTKYINGIFTSSQSFCSFECAHRYCYDCKDNYQESLSLLYLYYYQIYHKYDIIKLPKSPSTLKHNGGNTSIDKYRKNFKIDESINNYPITKLQSDIKVNNNTNIFSDKIQNLKLYRINKLSKNKNNIFNKMNLYVTDE